MTPRHATLEPGSGTLADLIADARAIPAAAYGVTERATRRASRAAVIDLAEPAQRAVLTIPAAAASLLEHAEQAFADYLR